MRQQAGVLRGLVIVGASDLGHWAKASQAHDQLSTRLRIFSQIPLATCAVCGVLYLFYGRMKLSVKRAHQIAPLHLAFGDFVKALFNFRRKVVIDNRGEVIDQEIVHHKTNIGRNQLALIRPHLFNEVLGLDRCALEQQFAIRAVFTFDGSFLDVFFINDSGNRSRVG